MNLFKRLSTTVTHSVSQTVAHLENHDAVVAVVLRDTKRAAARARVRLQRVQQDGAALGQRLHELQATELAWVERAKEAATLDESKALECVRRRNQCREEIDAVTTALTDHKTRQSNLTAALARIERQVEHIELSRNLLRTRESTAAAARSLAREDRLELDEVMQRWEAYVLEAEYSQEAPDDPFEAEFVEQEASAALRAQLDEILREEKPS